MRILAGFLASFLLLFCASPSRAADLLTIAYSSNSMGEYAPCPT